MSSALGKCDVCGQFTDTAAYCRLCDAMIGDCCRNKPHARAWAATKRAMKSVRDAYLKRAS